MVIWSDQSLLGSFVSLDMESKGNTKASPIVSPTPYTVSQPSSE